MKVRMKVQLKVGDGSIIPANTCYDDANGDFPDHVTNNLGNTNILEITDAVVSDGERPTVLGGVGTDGSKAGVIGPKSAPAKKEDGAPKAAKAPIQRRIVAKG